MKNIKMNRLKIAIILFVLGSFFLIAATFISTIKLSNLERQITKNSNDIDEYLSQTKSTLMMAIFYEVKNNKFQMDAFQRNFLIQTKAPPEAVLHFNERLQKDMSKLAEGWNTLMAGKEANDIKEEIIKTTNEIQKNPSLNHSEKMEKLIDLEREGIEKLNSRLKEEAEQFDKTKLLLLDLKKQHSDWKNHYTWLQILGLILIFVSQLFEKSIPDRPTKIKSCDNNL